MAFLLHTEITINSTPEKIWNILIDFEKYPSWNPFITSLSGITEVGKTLIVKIEPPGMSPNVFKPKVTAFEPLKKLSWLGVFGFSGILDGEHQFELIDNKNGTTTFKQSEDFKGILVPFFKKMLNVNTRNGFEAMNKKIKELAENS